MNSWTTLQQVKMKYSNKLHIILLKIIISNIIFVYTTNELSQNTEPRPSINIDDLDTLFRRYPAFIQLTLQQQGHYTGKNVARCPMPCSEDTVIDDLDEFDLSPKDSSMAWMWTDKNHIDVPVPINGTVGKKLGKIIQPCLKNNTNILQGYTHYLNVIESVGLTIADRFCLYGLEIIDRLDMMEEDIDYQEDYSLFEITVNFPTLRLINDKFKHLLTQIVYAFQQYYISTLPLDCVANAFEHFIKFFDQNNMPINPEDPEVCYTKYLHSRELMKRKINYASLDGDELWKWDITSESKPDDNTLILIQFANIEKGLKLFFFNE